MIHHRTKAEVRRFDFFKLAVAIVLIILLVWQLTAGQGSDDVAETAVAPTTAEPTDTSASEPAAEESTVPEPASVMAPKFQMPDGDLRSGETTLTGLGEPGSTVEVAIDGTNVGQAVVGNDGTWSLPVMLEAGTMSVQVRSLDADGVETAVSDPATVTIKAPTLPSFNFPADLTAGEFMLDGKADPGAAVEFVANGEVVGTAVTDADGNWSLPLDLPAGDYALNARVMDAAGNLVVESEPMDVAIAPAFVMPAFTLPTADADNPFPLSGTGQPGGAVDILVDGEVVGTAVIGDDGAWSFDYELGPGEHEISLQTVDGSGNLVAVEPFMFTMQEMAMAAAPSITSPASGDALASGAIAFSGEGEPGSEVEIVDNGVVVGTAVVGDDGLWSFDYNLEESGEHEFVARTAGSETGSAPIQTTVAAAETTGGADETAQATFGCAEGLAGIDRGDTYVVGSCDYMAKIANQTGVNLQDLIAANPQVADPNLIFPEQVLNMPPR